MSKLAHAELRFHEAAHLQCSMAKIKTDYGQDHHRVYYGQVRRRADYIARCP